MGQIELKPLRDAQRTRQAILSAAQQSFGTKGFSAAGVREITAAAGVNPSLVNRYFGSKERLFEEALAELLDESLITSAAREDFGEAMVVLLCESGHRAQNPLRMMVLASADEGARAISARLLRSLVIVPFAKWVGGEQANSCAARFVMVAAGLSLYSQIYPLEELTEPLDPAARTWLVAAFQSLVD